MFTDGKKTVTSLQIKSCFFFFRYFIHPDSPQPGAQWMKQSILFNKVKVTNNPMQNPNQVKISFFLIFKVFQMINF
jgi:hypothetical protein